MRGVAVGRPTCVGEEGRKLVFSQGPADGKKNKRELLVGMERESSSRNGNGGRRRKRHFATRQAGYEASAQLALQQLRADGDGARLDRLPGSAIGKARLSRPPDRDQGRAAFIGSASRFIGCKARGFCVCRSACMADGSAGSVPGSISFPLPFALAPTTYILGNMYGSVRAGSALLGSGSGDTGESTANRQLLLAQSKATALDAPNQRHRGPMPNPDFLAFQSCILSECQSVTTMDMRFEFTGQLQNLLFCRPNWRGNAAGLGRLDSAGRQVAARYSVPDGGPRIGPRGPPINLC